MCYKLLGPTIDIHAGGIDLVFPHHQNEIAQTEAFTGQQFSKYWLHNGFVNINNEKMSKSLKNFKTLRDIVTKPSDARAFRFLIVSAQYRNPLNFTPETFQAAINSLKRIDKLIDRLNEFIQSVGSTSFGENKGDVHDDNDGNEHKAVIKSIITLFEAAMCDDLNTPKAVAALFKLISEAENVIKRQQMCKSIAALYLDGINKMDQVFGVLYEVSADYFIDNSSSSSSSSSTDRRKSNNDGVVYNSLDNAKFGRNPMHPIDCECESEDSVIIKVKQLASQRVDFKTKKMYKEADKIREEIIALGYGIKDVKDNADGYEVFVL
jgi:cysteinyl-tRNA synthetase